MWMLIGLTILTFVASLIAVPIMLARIPPDYFTHDKRPKSVLDHQHGAIRLILKIAKNLLGGVLLLAGVAMLMLPGQGILTIIVGFLLIDGPGKYRLEKWLVSRKRVLKAINWFRKKRHREPLEEPSGKGAPEPA